MHRQLSVVLLGACLGACSVQQTQTETEERRSALTSATGSLNLARSAAAGVRMNDGRVLIVGGSTVFGDSATAEIYDPATGTWTSTGSLSQGRQGATAALLPSGKVLVAGGGTSNGFPQTITAEVFDPTTGTFSVVGSTDRSFLGAAAQLPDGRLLVTGGSDSSGTTRTGADLVGETGVTAAAPMTFARRAHTATTLASGKVLVAGGTADEPGTGPLPAELYDPATDTWTTVGSLSAMRIEHAAVRLSDGRVVIAGGDGAGTTVEIFDPATNTFSLAGNLVQNRWFVSGIRDASGAVLLFGGGGPDAMPSGFLDTIEKYDPSTQTSSIVDTMITGRFYTFLSSLADGRILIAGGNGAAAPGVLASSELYGTACVPLSCATYPNFCGSIPDGCGGTLSCSCRVGETCSGGGCVYMASYDSTLGAPACETTAYCDSGQLLYGRAGLGPEQHAPNTLTASPCMDGTNGTYHADESSDRISVYTPTGTPITAGQPVKIVVTVWTYSAADKLDLYFAPDAASSSWSYVTTISTAGSGPQVLSTTFTLPTNATRAVIRANFRYNGAPAVCAFGFYDDHDDLVFRVAGGVNDTTPPTTSITAPAAGATVSGTVSVTATASDNVGVTRVELYDGSTLIATVTSAPYIASWDTSAVFNGTHTLTSKAYDGSGNVGTSAPVTVTVDNAAPSGQAAYNATYQAPACTSVGSSCDSMALLNGRASLGPEAHAPNTLNGACADGTAGTYHSDESLDSLKISRVDGTNLAAGKLVRVDAKVWGWGSTGASDYLDLYYAPNASGPSWTYLGTIAAGGSGVRNLSLNFTLQPGSSTQVLRGIFRYAGNIASCGVGSFTDNDDLVFTVQ